LLNNAPITWGISPVWQPSLKPVPIVYVFPDPVCSSVCVCVCVCIIINLQLENPAFVRNHMQEPWHYIGGNIWGGVGITWPYARTVALYPWNNPSTSGATHCSNMADDSAPPFP
jgi:hypothetical protein